MPEIQGAWHDAIAAILGALPPTAAIRNQWPLRISVNSPIRSSLVARAIHATDASSRTSTTRIYPTTSRGEFGSCTSQLSKVPR